jgi:hypothetical protein
LLPRGDVNLDFPFATPFAEYGQPGTMSILCGSLLNRMPMGISARLAFIGTGDRYTNGAPERETTFPICRLTRQLPGVLRGPPDDLRQKFPARATTPSGSY